MVDAGLVALAVTFEPIEHVCIQTARQLLMYTFLDFILPY
jgi:hypothetical protein